jgi:uncharacterized membrane protein
MGFIIVSIGSVLLGAGIGLAYWAVKNALTKDNFTD